MRIPRPALAALLVSAMLTPSPAASQTPAAPTSPAAPAAPKGMHTILLVRHGLYDRDETVDDRVGNGLNATGRQQATAVGRYLASLPVKLNSLTSSTLTRARETADLMGVELKRASLRDSLISECTPISDRGDWMRMDQPAEIVKCEANLLAAWERYTKPTPEADTYDVLVAHGNVIRWFVAKAMGGDTRLWSRLEVGHGSITALTVSADGRVRVVKLSDNAYLPVPLQTYGSRGPGWK